MTKSNHEIVMDLMNFVKLNKSYSKSNSLDNIIINIK